jgi:diguanylate cyclase (GGDEF)-like protein
VRLTVARRITQLYRALEARQLELQVLNRQLHDIARTDPLTELGTRLKLREDLDFITVDPCGRGETHCAIMCDVDHFKQYNDRYGHIKGDDVLRAVAATLKAGLRQGEAAYRYGGEEFLLILRSESLEGGLACAERHRAAIEALGIPHQSSPSRVVTISCGAALFRPDAGTPVHAWLDEADGALYRAKKMGRNRVIPPHFVDADLDGWAASGT